MNSFAFHETKPHGTTDFPVEFFHIDISHPRYNMPFHWHKEWELIRILKGTFPIHADEAEILAKEGDILLIRDGMLHGGTPKDCEYQCFLFDLHSLFRSLEQVKKYLRPVYRHQLLPQILYPAGQDPALDTIVSGLMEAFTRQVTAACPELSVIGGLSLLFAHITTNGYYTLNEESSSSNHRIDQVKSVMEHIENHYASPITLDQLAQVAGMNPKYFCRFFRSITQQTPMDYVNYYRAEKAAVMLCNTDLSVTQIGLDCGFNDGSYFVKAFKKYKTMTPYQYRKSNP